MEHRRLVPGFASSAEVTALRQAIAARADLFAETSGHGGLGPRYRVIHGEQIHAHLPALEAFGAGRVRPLVETFVGGAVESASPRAALRVQVFEGRHREFRWHYDGHPVAALLTLENDNRAETQIVSPRLSRVLRPLYFPLYAAPRLFSLAPHERITMAAGDLLLMWGERVLHRGVAPVDTGRRTLVVWGYQTPGYRYRHRRLRGWLARRVNY